MKIISKNIFLIFAVAVFILIMPLTNITGETSKIQSQNLQNNITINQNAGEIEWELTLGGIGFDACYSSKETDDGEYIFAGGSYSFGPGLSDVWILKTNIAGDILWNKTYGGPRNESCYSLQKTSDDCYVVTGKTKVVEPDNFDVLLMKIDDDGNELWNKTYGGEEFDAGWWVEPTLDDGLIIVGITYSKGIGEGDIWVIKTNAAGDIIWDETYGGPHYESAEEVLVLADGTFIIVGYTESYGSGDRDLWIFKIDSNGDLIWEKIYGGNLDDEGWSIESCEYNSYFIFGRTYSFGAGNQDFWLIKTDDNGEIILNRTFGGEFFDEARRIQKTDNGNFLLIGSTESFNAYQSDYWLIAIDNNGYEMWDFLIGFQDFEIGYDVQKTDDSGYILTGITYNPSNHGEAWLVKLFPYENQQPLKPDKPLGPTKIKPNQYYDFSTKSMDFDEDNIFYRWDWGDGSLSSWIGPYNSNETCKESHSWLEKGKYQIRVQAKDTNGGESDWSDPLNINVPRSKISIKHYWKNINDMFPILQKILNFLAI